MLLNYLVTVAVVERHFDGERRWDLGSGSKHFLSIRSGQQDQRTYQNQKQSSIIYLERDRITRQGGHIQGLLVNNQQHCPTHERGEREVTHSQKPIDAPKKINYLSTATTNILLSSSWHHEKMVRHAKPGPSLSLKIPPTLVIPPLDYVVLKNYNLVLSIPRNFDSTV